MSMLRRVPDAYKNIEGQNGPSLPAKDSTEWEPYIRSAIAAAVRNNDAAIDLYMKSKPEWKELFPWYRYLFVSRSKPTTHLQALADVDSDELAKNAPPPLKRLLKRCERALFR